MYDAPTYSLYLIHDTSTLKYMYIYNTARGMF